MPTMPGTSPREIERASWSQGVLTLISILIGTALAIAVSKTEQLTSIDRDSGIRLLSFAAYCATFFWFYHRFYVFVYRRASIFSILLPSIVGSALMATAYSVHDSRRFAVWSFILLAGGCYSLGVTAFSAWRGKYQVIEGLPSGQVLRSFSFAMIRSAFFLGVMACFTGALLWTALLPPAISLDTALLVGNGAVFVLMSSLNWWLFTKPLERLVDSPEQQAPTG
jgi:hypothetical protein